MSTQQMYDAVAAALASVVTDADFGIAQDLLAALRANGTVPTGGPLADDGCERGLSPVIAAINAYLE